MKRDSGETCCVVASVVSDSFVPRLKLGRSFEYISHRDIVSIEMSQRGCMQRSAILIMLAFWVCSSNAFAEQESLPAQLNLKPALGNLNCEFPKPYEDNLERLNKGDLVVIPCKHGDMSGIKFWLSLGEVSAFEAAALWWDVPSQMEIFPGKFAITNGSLADATYSLEITGDVPGLGEFYQSSVYMASVPFPDVFQIMVGVPHIFMPGYPGSGQEGYRFIRLGSQTVYEGYSIYTTSGPNNFYDEGAKWAARRHRERYINGARPTPLQEGFFSSALKGAAPSSDAGF